MILGYHTISEDGHNYKLIQGDGHSDKFVILNDHFNDISDLFLETTSLENIENMDLCVFEPQQQDAEPRQVMIAIDDNIDHNQEESQAEEKEIILTLEMEDENEDHMITSEIVKTRKSEESEESQVAENCENEMKFYGTSIYVCKTCHSSFVHENMLSSHLYTAHQEQSFLCQHCSFVTQDIQLFNKHQEEPHGSTASTIPSFPIIKRAKSICKVCNPPKVFSSKTMLTQHFKNIHASATCEICQSVIPNKTLLRIHMTNWHKDSKIR